MARCADSSVDHEGNAGKIGAHGAQRVGIGEAAAGSDGSTPGHQDAAARRHEPLGRAEVLGGVGKDLEPLRAQGFGRFDKAEEVWLQRVVVGDDFELDPRRFEKFPRHVRRGDRFARRAAARGVRQHAHAQRADQFQEAFAGAPPRLFAAQGHGDDAGARSLHGIGHDLRRGIKRRAEQQARPDLRPVDGQRAGPRPEAEQVGFARVHGTNLGLLAPARNKRLRKRVAAVAGSGRLSTPWPSQGTAASSTKMAKMTR